jgi:HK97 gp10 family phage protein
MADLSIGIPKYLMNRLNKMATSKDTAPKMIKAAQKVVLPEVKRRLSSHVETGDLLDSVRATEPKMNKNGEWKGYISFPGKGKNGTPNGQKALTLEYGSSKQLASPFIRPAKEEKQLEAEEAMQKVFDEASK